MDCKHVDEAGVIEQYLTGGLNPADQDAFEEHFFACPRCFEQLETYRTLQAALAEAGPAIRAEAAAEPARLSWRWVWIPAVGVAGIYLALWLTMPAPEVQPPPSVARPTPMPAPGPSLAELAQVQPPVYAPVTLRGATDEATQRFREAMKQYEKGDYRSAIPGLRAAAELDPEAPNISFYLAICYLLTDQTDAAIDGLKKTIALGDTPYLEEARFYLAKAYLRKGDVAAARRELDSVVELRGDREAEARQLLRQLEAVSPAAH